MRDFVRGSILVVGFAFLALASTAATASADTLSVSGQQIRITATVAPVRTVIIDTSGDIRQIISNTEEKDVEIRVYVGTPTEINQIPTTPQLAQQVQQLLKNKTLKPGILYQRPLLSVRPLNPGAATLLLTSNYKT